MQEQVQVLDDDVFDDGSKCNSRTMMLSIEEHEQMVMDDDD